MAHTCISCGDLCNCLGNLDGLKPSKCHTCGCMENDSDEEIHNGFETEEIQIFIEKEESNKTIKHP